MPAITTPALPAASPGPGAAASPTWSTADVPRLAEAEALLDEFEVRGVRDREVAVLADDRFSVRWR